MCVRACAVLCVRGRRRGAAQIHIHVHDHVHDHVLLRLLLQLLFPLQIQLRLLPLLPALPRRPLQLLRLRQLRCCLLAAVPPRAWTSLLSSCRVVAAAPEWPPIGLLQLLSPLVSCACCPLAVPVTRTPVVSIGASFGGVAPLVESPRQVRLEEVSLGSGVLPRRVAPFVDRLSSPVSSTCCGFLLLHG